MITVTCHHLASVKSLKLNIIYERCCNQKCHCYSCDHIVTRYCCKSAVSSSLPSCLKCNYGCSHVIALACYSWQFRANGRWSEIFDSRCQNHRVCYWSKHRTKWYIVNIGSWMRRLKRRHRCLLCCQIKRRPLTNYYYGLFFRGNQNLIPCLWWWLRSHSKTSCSICVSSCADTRMFFPPWSIYLATNSEDAGFALQLRLLLALAFVPVADVEAALDFATSNFPAEAMRSFVQTPGMYTTTLSMTVHVLTTRWRVGVRRFSAALAVNIQTCVHSWKFCSLKQRIIV